MLLVIQFCIVICSIKKGWTPLVYIFRNLIGHKQYHICYVIHCDNNLYFTSVDIWHIPESFCPFTLNLTTFYFILLFNIIYPCLIFPAFWKRKDAWYNSLCISIDYNNQMTNTTYMCIHVIWWLYIYAILCTCHYNVLPFSQYVVAMTTAYATIARPTMHWCNTIKCCNLL